MTDHTRSGHDAEDPMDDLHETGEMDDLELITMAVNGHLSRERVEAVRHRLETDAAFRELAAPVLLTWSVRPRLEAEPRSLEELERDWDAFAKKAGIGRYRVATREPSGPGGGTGRGGRRGWWLAGVVLVVAGIAGMMAYVASRRAAAAADAALAAAAPSAAAPSAAPATAPATAPVTPPVSTDAVASGAAAQVVSTSMSAPDRAAAREAALDSISTRVPYQAGWMPLMDGIEVQLEPGTSLRRAHRRLRGMRHVLLEGTARFRVPDVDSAVTSFRTQSLVVETPVGFVTVSNAELTVTTHGDTTDVQVHLLPLQPKPGADGVTLADVLDISRMGQILFLGEPGGMRLVRGHDPERLSIPR